MIYLLLAILATYRLAYDITSMDGPFSVFLTLRGVVEERFGEYHWVSQGINCPICASFWLSVPIALAALMGDSTVPMQLWPLYWLGAAGGALVIVRVTSK